GQRLGRPDPPHGGRTGHVADKRDLAEALPDPQPAHRLLAAPGNGPEHLDLALGDDVEPAAAGPPAKDHLAGLEGLPAYAERPVGLELHDVGGRTRSSVQSV